MYKNVTLIKMLQNTLSYLFLILISAVFVSCCSSVATDQDVVITKMSTSTVSVQTQGLLEITMTPSPSITSTPELSTISTSDLAEGSYIVYSAMEGISDVGYKIYSLYLMDIQGNEYGILAHNIFESDISSDGSFIIHRRYSEDFSETELIVFELDSGSEYVLTNGTDCAWPSLSPNGKWVVSTCTANDIYAISIPEGNKVLIADCEALGGACTHPLWSPDDNFIAINYIEEFHPGWGWYLLDPKCIHDESGCNDKWRFAWAGTGIGAWSEDGNYFIFDKGDWTLSIIYIENNSERQIEIPTLYEIYSFDWSPDSKLIAISASRPGSLEDEIALLNVETGEIVPISYGHKRVQFWVNISNED